MGNASVGIDGKVLGSVSVVLGSDFTVILSLRYSDEKRMETQAS